MTEPRSQLPPWPEYLAPVLRALLDGEPKRVREIDQAAFIDMGLSPEALAETISSGTSRAKNRAQWAITHCHRAGLIQRVARGTYRITERGAGWLREHPNGFDTPAEIDRFFKPFWSHSTDEASSDSPSPTGEPAEEQESSPRELIEQGISELRADAARDLLARLRESDPTFFEEAVVQLLLAMGYGGAERRGQRIGGTGDGGVDGVIDQDALGLDQIYVQAKRYADGHTVGRETIQAFAGALQGRGASRGVFITSSSYSKGAKEFADRVQARIILIDGHRLADLMIKYRVGVQVQRTYEVVEIDEDFFE